MTLIATLALAVTLQTVPLDQSWVDGWVAEVKANGGLTFELIDQYRAARWKIIEPEPARIAARATPAPSHPVGPPPASVEVWRPLVAAYFQPDHVDAALRVLACESRGNPNAVNASSGASGLFQAMPNWYTGRGWDRPSPFGPFDPHDPDRNVAFAAWLFYQTGTWQHWVCKP